MVKLKDLPNGITKDELYYNGSKLLSYAMALMYFCIGGRGAGKTYWFKRFCIRKFIKNGDRWVYIRRYKTELKMKSSFLDDIRQEFPNHKLEMRGFEMFCDDKSMGYVISLSTNKTAKGQVFDNVKNIIYDEFMFESTSFYRYIDDEVELFMELFESIARLNDDVRCYFLANAISVVNPYFLYYNVEPRLGHDPAKPIEHLITKTSVGGALLITEVYYNDYFEEYKRETKFGKLIDGTKFGDYLIGNKMKADNSVFIEKKPAESKYMYTLCYHGFMIGVWYSPKLNTVYVSPKCDRDYHTCYVFDAEDFTGTQYMAKSYKDYPDLKSLVYYFKHDQCRFDSMNMKSMFYSLMRTIKCW